jgi:hypothetical protein
MNNRSSQMTGCFADTATRPASECAGLTRTFDFRRATILKVIKALGLQLHGSKAAA